MKINFSRLREKKNSGVELCTQQYIFLWLNAFETNKVVPFIQE